MLKSCHRLPPADERVNLPVNQPTAVDRAGLAAVLLVALGLRIALGVLQPAELTHDRDAYLGIARQIAGGHGYCSPGSTAPTAFRPPLYPLLLAAAGSILPWPAAVVTVNAIGAVLLVAGVWLLADHLGLRRFRRIAGFLAAIEPLLVQYAGQPMTESLFAGLVAIWLASATRTSTGWRGDTLTGILFGLAVLCRPTLWPLAGLYGAVWSWRIGGGIRAGSVQAACRRLPWASVLAAALVVAPWTLRNQVTFGVPLLTTTHGGYTLLLANNPVFYRDVVSQPVETAWPGDSLLAWQTDLAAALHAELGPSAGEVAEDRIQSRWAWRYIREHPQAFLESMGYRIRSLWRLAPQGSPATGLRIWLLRAVAGFYLVLFLFAVVGLVRVFAAGNVARWLPLLMVLVTVQTVHLFYWTDARMRAPLVPALVLLAAYGVQEFLTTRRTTAGD